MNPIEAALHSTLEGYLKGIPAATLEAMQPDLDAWEKNVAATVALATQGNYPEEEIRHLQAQLKNLALIHGLESKERYKEATLKFIHEVVEILTAIAVGIKQR